MKWFVYLFSFYLMLLPWIPGTPGDDCCIEEVTINYTSNQQPDDQQEDHCPPLFACCSCHGVVVAPTCAIPSLSVPYIFTIRSIYSDRILTDIAWSVWQPPKPVV